MHSTSLTPVLLAVAVLAGTAQAAPLKIQSEGTAVAVKGNPDISLTRATRAALGNAIAEALTQMGGAAEDAEALFEKHGPEFLKSYDVADQGVDTNIHTVKVTATIDGAALAKRAGVNGKGGKKAQGGAGNRKVMILATEQLGPNQIIAWSDLAFSVGPGSVSASSKTKLIQLVDEMGGLQATLSEAFANAGFTVIDLKALRGKLSKPSLEVVDLTAPMAQDIARKGDADIVIVVKGRANNTHVGVIAESGMHSGSGNVVAQAIRVSDGRVLSSTNQQGAKIHLDRQTAQVLALNEAGKLASAELLKSLASQ